jgi:AcrR family transcriptional regulator
MTADLRTQPQQTRSTERLGELLTAAREAADELGEDRVTTGEIAKRANCSIGTVYRYFPNRVAILNAMNPGRAIGAEVQEAGRRAGLPSDLADGTGENMRRLLPALQREVSEEHAAGGHATYADLLLSQTRETLSRDDPAELRAALIELAATAQTWIRALDDRRQSAARREADREAEGIRLED